MYEIHQADLVHWLRERQWLAQNGFYPLYHAFLGDPPYFLASIAERFGREGAAPAKASKDGSFGRLSSGFMGQQWDSFESMEHFQRWCTEWGHLLLDFAYPGAMGMFFGGTRTFHRLAVGLEDAGWEIVDVIMWVTAQGLSKGKEVTRYFEHKRRGTPFMKALTNDMMGATRMAERLYWFQQEKRWGGYKPTLKPAYEPVVVVRAPRQKITYADLAVGFGTGHFNIDGSRVNGRYPANIVLQHLSECGTHCVHGCPVRNFEKIKIQSGGDVSGCEPSQPAGGTIYGNYNREAYANSFEDGTLANFFYQAKAPAWERRAGLDSKSDHPTMKPIQLAENLARLLLPPDGQERRLLIPFSGVGSEMIGAVLSGWDSVTGIEQSESYVAQARQRLEWWSQYRTYNQAEEAYKSAQHGQQQAEVLATFGQLSLWG